MENCVFCQIVKGKLPSFKIHEDDNFYSFLSIGPHRPGHTLIIPKTHVEDFLDMDEELLREILIYAKPISAALKKTFQPKTGKVGLVVAGLEVPHAHLHLIPLDELSDLDFRNPKSASPEELQAALDQIKTVL